MLIYFRHELWAIITKWLRGARDPRFEDPDVRIGWFLIVATIPIGILGFIFRTRSRPARATCG